MEFVNNKREFRFEAQLEDGEFARLDYRWLKGNMVLMHTVVPPAHKGKGIGGALVKYVLDHVRQHHLKVIIYCRFADKYLKEHPEYNDLLANQPAS